VWDLWKSWGVLTPDDLLQISVGFVTAFFSALVAVRGFIRYVSRHDFRPFGWYRIVLGAAVMIYFLA
ncbi:MAG TPA: undecaprenyl-diphosphate phosphatase, partial [Candidatus Polarisedimenticolia bacterium]|nr:undecaprenyl-diphosphate phosphatase [Candidatus Polarisedimenticolia bacterium]